MNAMDVRLQQAIAAARAGKRDEARVVLDRFLQDQPDNVHAIFLMSTLASTREEQVENLQKVLTIDPDHRGAKLMLDRLSEPMEVEAETVVQPVVEDEEEPAVETAEPVIVTEDDLPAEEAIAATLVVAAGEMQDEAAEEIDATFVEETVTPELEETLIVYPTEEASGEAKESLETSEEEGVPEWLTEETGSEEEELAQEDVVAEEEVGIEEDAVVEEEVPLEMGELPDWLQEEPTEEWLSQEPPEVDETTEPLETEEAAMATMAVADEEVPMVQSAPEAPKPRRKQQKVSNRALEIVLALLIILALLVMVGLVAVVLTV